MQILLNKSQKESENGQIFDYFEGHINLSKVGRSGLRREAYHNLFYLLNTKSQICEDSFETTQTFSEAEDSRAKKFSRNTETLQKIFQNQHLFFLYK